MSSPNIDRRQALALLGALAAARHASGADAPLHFAALDHIEFTVSDVDKSLAFYVGIFGNTVMKNNQTTRRYIQLGSAYMALDKAVQVRVDHFCAGINGFDIAAVHAYLQQRGIAFRDFPSGKDLAVTDPDGVRTQLAASNGWDQLKTGTASPEAVAGAGQIFHATALDHVLLNVSDPEKSAAFYQQIFGAAPPGKKSEVWFQAGKSRIGLKKTAEGQRAGVNRFGISAERFDAAAATKRLSAAGAKVEASEIPGAIEFRDPDGFLLQVTPG